ncbi:MAG: MarR family transcriptional regulator [Pseudomonadota bacterium]
MDAVDKILKQWRLVRPDLDVGAMGPIGRHSRVHHHFRREMEATFAKHGLNGAGFDVLATLRRSPPPHALSPGELMSSMMITSGTMTNRIDQLVKVGLIDRKKDSDDARRAVIGLTEKGLALIDQAVADHVETQRTLLSGLTDAEIDQFDTVLVKLLKGIEENG